MNKIIIFLAFFVPSITFAAGLSIPQANAVLELLTAFGVDTQTIALVRDDLLPVATSTPLSVQNPVSQVSTTTTAFNPIVQNTPTFGSITVQPTLVTPLPCDDTPSITYHGLTSYGANTPTTFTVIATSACNSKFLIDWNMTTYGAIGHGAGGEWIYGIRHLIGQTNMSSGEEASWNTPSEPGTYTQTFVAHDDKTAGTTTVDIVVQ